MRSVSIAAAWVGVAALLSGCAARPQAQYVYQLLSIFAAQRESSRDGDLTGS